MASSFFPNIKWLKARIFKSLKHRSTDDTKIHWQDLELFLAEAFDLTHTGEESYYADGVRDHIQASIKTRAFDPEIKKTIDSRDFHTHSDKILGQSYIKKYDYYLNGVEIVQRRQALNLDDLNAPPELIGNKTLEEFQKNIEESYNRFNTSMTYEIVAAHGYSIDKQYYNVSVFWKEYEHLDPKTIEWTREGDRIVGYKTENNKKIKVAERMNGNAKRQATCFIEYKNILGYNNKIEFKVPVVKLDEFNVDREYAELEILEKQYESGL